MKSKINTILIFLFGVFNLVACSVWMPHKLDVPYSNTLFIYYTNKKEKSYVYSGKEKTGFGWYVFKFENNKFYNVTLEHKKYKDFDSQGLDLKTLSFKVNKSFLRKNKRIVLNEKAILKIGRTKFIKLLNNVDMVFLIDKNMTTNNQITIMEMSYYYNAEE